MTILSAFLAFSLVARSAPEQAEPVEEPIEAPAPQAQVELEGEPLDLAPAVNQPPRSRTFGPDDFMSDFASGNRALARAEWDAGRPEKAYELLSKEGDAPNVRYFRALAALRSNRPAEAAEAFEQLAQEHWALEDRCLAQAGLAREEMGHWQKAQELYSKVPEGSKLYGDAQLGIARALRKKGDAAGALKALEPLLSKRTASAGRSLTAEALLTAADLHAELKDVAAEREALLELYSAHPLSAPADLAEKRLRRVKISRELQVARAELLIEAHRNASGVKALKPLIPQLKLPGEWACRAHFAYGKAFRKQRMHSKAIAALKPVAEKCADAELRTKALYLLASSQSIVDQPNGVKSYERLVKEFPDHPFADDALFYAADLYLRDGDRSSASKKLDDLVARYPDGDFHAEAIFKRFWMQRNEGDTAGALETLAKIEERYRDSPETYEVERARYWKARTLEQREQIVEADETLEKLAAEFPATYYGLLARNRLAILNRAAFEKVEKALSQPPSSQGFWPIDSRELAENRHFQAGLELLRMGFTENAGAEFLSVRRTGLTDDSVRLLVYALSSANDAKSAHAVARTALRRDLQGRITAPSRAVWEMAYPNLFRDLVEKHSQPADVDPDLLTALMREESALDPKALSWAGAIGLTQLMPATANWVAKANKMSHITPQMLLNPDLNIRLGALTLGGLLKKFHGVKPHAIAGYNAGDGAVRRWLSKHPQLEVDEWVEEIPISETRGYVKRVLRSYNTYQLLYSQDGSLVSTAER